MEILCWSMHTITVKDYTTRIRRIAEADMARAEIDDALIWIHEATQESRLEEKWMPKRAMMLCRWDSVVFSETFRHCMSQTVMKFSRHIFTEDTQKFCFSFQEESVVVLRSSVICPAIIKQTHITMCLDEMTEIGEFLQKRI
jgi:hypothetical protein